MPVHIGKDLLVGPMGAGGGATYKLPSNNEIVAIGDSRVAQMIQISNYGSPGMGLTHVKRMMLGQIYLPYSNIIGTGGYTTSQVRSTHYPTAKATTAKTLFILCGVNNGNSAGAGAAAFADIEWMANDWVDSDPGRIVFVLDEMPTSVNGNNAQGIILRDSIRAMVDWERGIRIIPSWRAATGGNDGVTPLADSYADTVHPSVVLAYKLAYEIRTRLAPLIPESDFFGRTIAAGGDFVGATPAAAGLTVNNGAVTSGSVTTDMFTEDGLNWFRFNCTAVLGVMSVYPTSVTTPGWVTPGVTYIDSSLRVRVKPDLSVHGPAGAYPGQGIRQMRAYYRKQSGTDFGNSDARHPGSGSDATYRGDLIDRDLDLVLQLGRSLVPADATQLRWWNFDTTTRVSIPFTGVIMLALPQVVAS